MLETIAAWSPVAQALAAGLFTWGLTAIGAGAVFLFREVDRRVLDTALGFTAGVMIAASFWSLLNPAIALSEELGMISWLPPLIGFFAGALAMRGVWSLLNPALALSHELGMLSWLRRLIGSSAAPLAMRGVDYILPHVHLFARMSTAEGMKTTWRRTTLMVLAITLHNIPEGLAV